jgi:hypothetical protein
MPEPAAQLDGKPNEHAHGNRGAAEKKSPRAQPVRHAPIFRLSPAMCFSLMLVPVPVPVSIVNRHSTSRRYRSAKPQQPTRPALER